MTQRYHVAPDGRLLACTASVRECPYGNHFSTGAYTRIMQNRPTNHREMTAWFNLQVALEGRKISDIRKRRGWGYNADFMQALLYAERRNDVKLVNLLHSLRERYGNPRSGGHRAVFDRGDGHLIKVPMFPIAAVLSHREAQLYANPDAEIRMVPCHEERIDGVTVLVTEKVRIPEPKELALMDLPAWVSEVDMQQVGFDKGGNLVAYDL